MTLFNRFFSTRTFPLLQYVRDALHADDVLAVHVEYRVVRKFVGERRSLIGK